MDKDKASELYSRGILAESALEYLSSFFPKYRERLLKELMSCKQEELIVKREVIKHIDKIETQMKQEIISAQQAVKEAGELYEAKSRSH